MQRSFLFALFLLLGLLVSYAFTKIPSEAGHSEIISDFHYLSLGGHGGLGHEITLLPKSPDFIEDFSHIVPCKDELNSALLMDFRKSSEKVQNNFR